MKKSIYRNLLIVSILLADCQIGIGQYQPIKIIPPTPEASSVFKFTEVPVSYFSGLANTSIPLFNIKAGSINIPIDLSYHARGVRVEEIAPRVGIGWSLNYGGMISRQIRGLPDDGTPGAPSFYETIFTDPIVAGQVYNDNLNTPLDFEPDMYFFNVGGISGKFMFDPRDKGVLLQAYSDTRIVPVINNSQMEGLILTDNQGNKYYFGLSKNQQRSAFDYDAVHNFSFSQLHGMKDIGDSEDRPITTWHLLEIETASNDLIEFTYEVEDAIYYKRQYDKMVYDEIPDDITQAPELTSFFGRVQSWQNQIKEISFRNGKIKFTKSTAEREDIFNAYALEKVELFDKNDVLVKGYSFQYEYPVTVQDNNQLGYLKTVDPGSGKRLFLHSIQETGRNGSALPPYVFTYSNIPLPNRFSNSQDAWGYYNGKNNGQYLTFFNYTTYNISRQVDTVKCEAGLLKKISYPTGGSVSFTYEQNKAVPPAYLNKLLYQNINPTEIVPVLAGFLKHPSYFDGDETYSKEFTIKPDKTGPVTFSFELPWCGTENDEPSVCDYRVYLEGEGKNIFLYPPGGTKTLNIGPGTYRLKVVAPGGHDPSDSRNTFFADIRWNEERNIIDESESNLLLASGKRIKRIEYRNQDGIAKIKEFNYTNPATGKSSGVIFGLPNFYFIQSFAYLGGEPIPIVDKYGSLPGSPLSNLQGNGVGYSHVTEYYGDAVSNTGKIEYKFTTTEDGGKYYEFPYHMPIDNEWLRGKIDSMRVFEKTSSGYTLKKETVNKYTYAGHPEVEAVFFTPFLPIGQNHVYNKNRKNFYLPLLIFHKDTVAPYNYIVYYQTGGVMDMYQTIEKEYLQGGLTLTKQTDYSFDYNKHYQSIGNETNDSKGNKLVTKLYYPPDLTTRTAAEQKLVDLNRISAPIKVESFVKQKLTNAELSKVTTFTSFKDWGSNIITPELVQSANNANPLETDAQFYSYDNAGNPIEIAEKDGVHIVYLWGYAEQYPVAKVVESDYNTVKNLVNLTMLANAHQYTDQQIRDELNKIRTGLANTNAMVSTYTYKPLIGTTSETDAKGRTTYYEYDGLGQLVLIRDHDNNIVKKIGYHYVGSGAHPITYSNAVKSGTFTRDNCGTATASTVTYTVYAGTYSSIISQADADQKAQDDVNANGQNYANTNGTCTQVIYASIQTGSANPVFEFGCLYQYRDVIVRFYQDAAHTVPYSVTNLPIQIKKGTTNYTNGQAGPTSYATTTYTCNGTSFTLSQELTYSGCASDCPEENACLPTANDPHTVYSFSLEQTTFTITIP
jgi:YD repeat-containing protein